jgi:hypothetical protein
MSRHAAHNWLVPHETEGRAALKACLVMFGCSLVAAALAYFWAGITTSPSACSVGTRSTNGLASIGYLVLVLLGPVAGGWQARRSGLSSANAFGIVFLGVLLAVGPNLPRQPILVVGPRLLHLVSGTGSQAFCRAR